MKLSPLEKFGITTLEQLEEKIQDDSDFWEYAYEYYLPEMPYGTAKARDGDPDEWMFYRMEAELAGEV